MTGINARNNKKQVSSLKFFEKSKLFKTWNKFLSYGLQKTWLEVRPGDTPAA